MRSRFSTILAIAILCLASTTNWGDLTPYNQDFEALIQSDPDALANDGWLVFANVFTPAGGYLYGYGPFPAPNGGEAFSAIAEGEGGLSQGYKQLSVYSDYANGDHGNGNIIEANVFQEQTVGSVDIGSTWLVDFDFKRGNIEGGTTAKAFIKTIDPNNGFALTNFVTADMTNIPYTWGTSLLSIYVDSTLEDQILQFGFLSNATNYEGSGILYDNLSFSMLPEGDDDDDDDDSLDLQNSLHQDAPGTLFDIMYVSGEESGAQNSDSTEAGRTERGGTREQQQR